MSDKTLYYVTTEFLERPFILAATERGLCYVDNSESTFTQLKDWVNRSLPTFTIKESESFMAPFVKELSEYFEGSRTEFTVPLALNGSEFQLRVWDQLSEIPYGQTVAYFDIAERLGDSGGVRAVASAIAANPILIFLPCHRVIAKDGALSGYRAGVNLKRYLLELEERKKNSD